MTGTHAVPAFTGQNCSLGRLLDVLVCQYEIVAKDHRVRFFVIEALKQFEVQHSVAMNRFRNPCRERKLPG